MSTCQLCSQKKPCRLVPIETAYLHANRIKKALPPFNRMTGRQGKAGLSVCSDCEEQYGYQPKSVLKETKKILKKLITVGK